MKKWILPLLIAVATTYGCGHKTSSASNGSGDTLTATSAKPPASPVADTEKIVVHKPKHRIIVEDSTKPKPRHKESKADINFQMNGNEVVAGSEQ